MHDSYTPLGGLVPLFLMQFSETILGGVGSGLYGMLIFVIVAVFIAGLMVGRTPEYLGKKIESYEMKMASLIVLIMPFVVLIFTAIAVVVEPGLRSISNPGAHGFSEVLYAFSSQGNNNGSAFAGLSANTPFYNTARRPRDARLALLAGHPDSRHRRLAGEEEAGAGRPWHAAHAYAAVRRLPDRRRRAGRGADLLPGPGARPDRRAPADDCAGGI